MNDVAGLNYNHTQPVDIADYVEDLHYVLMEEDERNDLDILRDGMPILYTTAIKVPIMFHGIESEKWIDSEEIFDYFLRSRFVLKSLIDHLVRNGELFANRVEIIRDNDRYYAKVSDLIRDDVFRSKYSDIAFLMRLYEPYWKIIGEDDYVSAIGLHNIINAKDFFTDQPQKPTHKFKTYLIKDIASGLIKIGRSRDPESRLSHFQTANPNCKLVAVCESDIEYKLHIKYDEKRYKGEWFNLSKDDVNHIVSEYGFTINESSANHNLN